MGGDGINPSELKLAEYMKENGIVGEHLVFDQSCHSVEEAAAAASAAPDDFIKNICLIGDDGTLIVAIVNGRERASTTKIGKALGITPPRVATSDEVLRYTGYPIGGVPSFGYPARFLIDPRVLEKDFVLSGGGSPNSLLRVSVKELTRANQALTVRMRK